MTRDRSRKTMENKPHYKKKSDRLFGTTRFLFVRRKEEK